MKLQFTTSISDGYMEGQEIDVATPSPQHLEWLRRGILVPSKSVESETALAPDDAEKAISRRGGRGRRGKRRSHVAHGSADDDGSP